MQILTSLTQKGQITIPKKLRKKYNIEKYEKLFLEEGIGHIKIKPAKDILSFAGTIKPKKKGSVLLARESIETNYKRV